MWGALFDIAEIYESQDKVLVITSANDGAHMKGSKHYTNEAVDLRTFYFSNWTARKVTRKIKKKLGKDFDVVFEGDHIHVEYDPKGRG